jgi:hypothetical protein
MHYKGTVTDAFEAQDFLQKLLQTMLLERTFKNNRCLISQNTPRMRHLQNIPEKKTIEMQNKRR